MSAETVAVTTLRVLHGKGKRGYWTCFGKNSTFLFRKLGWFMANTPTKFSLAFRQIKEFPKSTPSERTQIAPV
jgi:hypothetical protein